ncbi:MAG TPA: hypothetical protein VMJ70_14055 [Candidatus Sulfotelmatobacter sp.]|nr:hypothetical protein [Candidatus Sulfotelmatobacter sp.]
MNLFGGKADERILAHRLRATSAASLAGILVTMGLFIYHDWVQHVWNWELLAIGITMVAVKQGLMLWLRFHN